MTKQILLILTLFVISCKSPTNETEIKTKENTAKNNVLEIKAENYIEGISKKVEQNISDTKIILSELNDPYDLHLYGKIKFIVDNKTILEYKTKHLEIEGYQGKVCTFFEQRVNDRFVSYYIFKSNNRPEPNKFLIFKQTEKKIKLIGETEETTADIYGDVDLDGKFEIGGFNTYCQPGIKENEQPNHPQFCIEHLRIYEIGDSFERDKIMENFIKNEKNVW